MKFFKAEDFAGIDNFHDTFMDEKAAEHCAYVANEKIKNRGHGILFHTPDGAVNAYAILDVPDCKHERGGLVTVIDGKATKATCIDCKEELEWMQKS